MLRTAITIALNICVTCNATDEFKTLQVIIINTTTATYFRHRRHLPSRITWYNHALILLQIHFEQVSKM